MREIPIQRAKINPDNGFVVTECPKTGKPTFTHVEGGCENCGSHADSTETTLYCKYEEDPSIKEMLADARRIIAELKKDKPE